MKKMIPIILTVMTAMILVDCSKEGIENPVSMQDSVPNDSNLVNIPQNDTVGIRFINTDELVNCMLINEIELKKDSFLIKHDSALHENFTGNNCINKLPEINFLDSMLIGYTTKIQGLVESNNRIITYDSTMNALTYTIKAFTSDTAMLCVELNWITLPKYNIDTVIYNFKTIKK